MLPSKRGLFSKNSSLEISYKKHQFYNQNTRGVTICSFLKASITNPDDAYAILKHGFFNHESRLLTQCPVLSRSFSAALNAVVNPDNVKASVWLYIYAVLTVV